NDRFNWAKGDGSDTLDGGTDFDTLAIRGGAGDDSFALGNDSGETLLLDGILDPTLSATLTLRHFERLEIRPLGGKDSIFIKDLARAGLRRVSVDLASTPGGKTGDGATDLVAIGGDDSGNQVVVTKAGAAISVSGVGATVSVSHSEGRDALVLEG